eukprot:XP_016860922.1 uncharacterized protein LOC107985770 isoform X5 [Homo sapiens]
MCVCMSLTSISGRVTKNLSIHPRQQGCFILRARLGFEGDFIRMGSAVQLKTCPCLSPATFSQRKLENLNMIVNRRSKIEELKTDLGGCLQLQEDVWEQTQKLSLPDKQDKETQNKSPSMWSENGIRADLKKLCSI